MKTKFTKGEWKDSNYAKGNIVSVFNGNERLVANCMGYSTNTDNGEHIKESLANAKLIAAAPELLKALVDLIKMSQQHEQLRTSESLGCLMVSEMFAEEAIKKAMI